MCQIPGIYHIRVSLRQPPGRQVYGTVQTEGQKGREHAGGMVGFECQRMTVDDHGVNEMRLNYKCRSCL